MSPWHPVSALPRERVAPFDGNSVDLWVRIFFVNRQGEKRTMLEYRVPDACWHRGQWCDAAGNPHDVLNSDRKDLEVTHWMTPPEGPSPGHASDCAVHNAPALPPGPCDCGLIPKKD